MKKYNVVIIVPDEGYTTSIYSKAAKIYKRLIREGAATCIIVSGATRDPRKMKSYGFKKFLEKFFEIISVQRQIEKLESQGVCKEDIIYENQSINTRENAINSLRLVKSSLHTENIYLFGSVEVLLRKYLTFKKAASEINLNIKIRVVPVAQLLPLKLIIARILLIPGEFWRIIKYHKLGHI